MRAHEFTKQLTESRVEYDKKTGSMGINRDDPDQRHGLYLNGKLVKTYDTREQAENMKKRSAMYRDATIKKIAESQTFGSKQEVIDHFVRQGKSAAAGAAAWERGWRGPKAKPKKPSEPVRSYHDDLDDKRYGETNESTEEQFCDECGGSLAEAGKASRSLCLSSKPNNELGASQLSSCKSQGLRARETNKKHTIANKRVKIKGKRVKGHEYGGPLPYNKSDKTK